LVNQGIILLLFWTDALPFLWFNLIAALGILIPAALIDLWSPRRKTTFVESPKSC
jgi:hypothetical protein